MLKTSKALSVGEGLHTMFPHGEDAKEDNIQFSWGQQIGVAGANGDFHLYESFTYDGVEYFLYDCVFVLRDGETEPDIGKLVKIWETASGKRRVKIVWFFQPPEIQNWLGDIQPLDNEIFLASGEGKGLFNLNPLESISGKCNVVCTSNDKRNQQPSIEQVMAADYIFFRSFDVGNCKISLSFPNIIAGTEVKNFLNRDNYRKPSTLKIRISSRDVHGTSVDRSLARNGQTSCNQSDMRHANANFSLTSSSDPRPLKKRTLQFNPELSKGVVEKYRRISEAPVARAEPDRIPTNKSSQFMEVTSRPEKDTSWFKPQPWEEKVSLAHGRGTIVLLENLDPSFTSSEVEDIVWHAFKVKADAKMVQRRAFSSPYYGQALVIFRSSEAAERAISEMQRKCLMMSTGRPIVGRKAPPLAERDPNKFFGHLEIEKLRYQKQRKEMKNAVSTSHYSQPNTIEYEMAVEWRALQAKSDLCYKALYEQQRKEIRALRQQLEEVV